jgi:hypothetical protein
MNGFKRQRPRFGLADAWAESLIMAEQLLEEPWCIGRKVAKIQNEINYCRANFKRAMRSYEREVMQ